MTENNDCIFCKIIKNDIPSTKVFEDEKVLAFLDIRPVNKGHVLIIPKEHCETLLDMSENMLKEVMVATKKIAKSFRKGLKAEGFNLKMNNFPLGGQEVMHAHIHLIPRFENDGIMSPPQKKYEEGEMDKIKEAIVTFL